MVHGGDLNLGHLDEARDILIKEYIYDHHNYKGGLSTCTLNGLELPWMMFLTSDAYSHDYQEYMWFMVWTWTLFNITSKLYRRGDEVWGALLLVSVTVQEHRHKCRECVLFNKHLVWCYQFCLHKRVTFDIIIPWKSLRSRGAFLHWSFPMLTYIILPEYYVRNLTPEIYILQSI